MMRFRVRVGKTNVLALYRESFALSKDNRGWHATWLPQNHDSRMSAWMSLRKVSYAGNFFKQRFLKQVQLPYSGGTATKFSWSGRHPTIIGLSARWRILKAWSLLHSWFCRHVASDSYRAFAVNGETYINASWPGVRPANSLIVNLTL
jgi:hypothetical protein